MSKVGDISLGLKLDKKGFERDLSSMTSLAKKAGAIIGSAFAVKKIVDFGKKAINLGSDLAEVQNVVDVAFPAMGKQIDDFAKNAAQSFGLSETMAKKYMGTFGAMSKAFGFGQKEAFEMASTLTGLAGDVASFYNMSQDEAYTKLKSVFTGETETLKELGVVMTQNALDQYAMANGFGKTTNAMTEQEKVALRYRFVMDQLSLANGDFIRTSDGWANQVRIMQLQIESFMATVGQGLINIFSPVLKWINILLSKLMTAANAFKAFTELLSGKKATQGSGIGEAAKDVANMSDNLEGATGGAGALGKATDGVGSAAKKAAKEMKALMGFDQINKLADPSDDSSGGGGGSGGAGGGGGSIQGAKVDMGKLAEGDEALSGFGKGLQKIIDYAKELGKLFGKGFEIGLNENSLNATLWNLGSIKKSLTDIFTDGTVLAAVDTFAKRAAFSLGEIVGSGVSIGISVAENITGGLAQYLRGSSGFIAESISGFFNAATQIADLSGSGAVAVGKIAESIKSEGAVNITSAFMEIFGNTWFALKELALQESADMMGLIVIPIADNADQIKKIFEDVFGAVGTFSQSVSSSVTDFWGSVRNAYDSSVKPMFDSLTKGLSEIVSKISGAWDKYIEPVITALGEKFADAWTNYAAPALQNIAGLFGDFADLVKAVWETALQPLIEWLVDVLSPIIAAIVDTAGEQLLTFFKAASNVFEGIIEILRGVIEFLTGIFSGDWKKCFDGILMILTGFKDVVEGIFHAIWGAIKTIFSPVIIFFKSIFYAARDHINAAFESIGSWFSDKWTAVKNVFKGVKDFFSSTFTAAYKAVTGIFGGIAGWFGGKFSAAWEAVKRVFSSGGKVFSGIKEGILSSLKAVVNALISGINTIISVPFRGLNSALDGIRGVSVAGFKPFGWLPSIWAPQIPYLAQGGYVKANTPQLAMIGDNKYYGEVVAPENKLLEMAHKAAAMAGGGDNIEVISLLRQLLKAVLSLNLTLDGRKVTKELIDTINDITARTGECPLIV